MNKAFVILWMIFFHIVDDYYLQVRQGHNFLKMYWSGEFSHEEGWTKTV